MFVSCGQDEPFRSPKKAYFRQVIGLYFLSFFHEHPVGYKIVRNILVARLLAQTTLRNILGTKNLHEILSDRDSISNSMQVMQLLSCS